MAWVQNRNFFYGRGGPKLMCTILDEQCTHAPAVAGAAAAAAAAATMSEPTKAELMKLEARPRGALVAHTPSASRPHEHVSAV